MSANYQAGIAREVIAKADRGETRQEIMRSLQVSVQYVDKVLSERHKHAITVELPVSYKGISEAGGY